MKTKVKQLKVKIKSLAAEARIIRLEEQRAKGRRLSDAGPRVKDEAKGYVVRNDKHYEVKGRDDELREDLHRHRIDVVQVEARLALLAYGFLRGRLYAQLERKPVRTAKVGGCLAHSEWKEPNWEEVADQVARFGPPTCPGRKVVEAQLKAWACGSESPHRKEKQPA